jgi:hypothetical protein
MKTLWVDCIRDSHQIVSVFVIMRFGKSLRNATSLRKRNETNKQTKKTIESDSIGSESRCVADFTFYLSSAAATGRRIWFPIILFSLRSLRRHQTHLKKPKQNTKASLRQKEKRRRRRRRVSLYFVLSHNT